MCPPSFTIASQHFPYTTFLRSSLCSARRVGGRIGRYWRGWGEFMDPATLTALYAMLATFGLVVTDTYFNANTMYLDTTVAESVKEEGYEPEVVDGLFISEAKRIPGTPSRVASPTIRSSDTKPVSAELAEEVGMESALGA